jgi:hypothetical protein
MQPLYRLRGDLLNVTRNQATTEEPLFQDLLGPAARNSGELFLQLCSLSILGNAVLFTP